MHGESSRGAVGEVWHPDCVRRHPERSGPQGRRSQGLLHGGEDEFDGHADDRHEDDARQHERGVLPAEAVDDEAAEPPAADERGEGGRGDHLHGGRAHSGRDDRHRQRQLHAPEHLAARHAHARVRSPSRLRRRRARPRTEFVSTGGTANTARARMAARSLTPTGSHDARMMSSAKVGMARPRLPMLVTRVPKRPTWPSQTPRGRAMAKARMSARALMRGARQPGGDAGRAGPVRRVGEPRADRAEGVHHDPFTRVHGVSSRSSRTSRPSSRSAITTTAIVPARICAW